MPDERISIARVIIINTYTWLNKGDAAIVLGTVEAIRRTSPRAAIAIVSQTPAIDGAPYKERGVEVLGGAFGLTYGRETPRLWRYLLFAASFLSLLVALAIARATRWAGVVRFVPGETGRVAQWLVGADLVLSCGGGFWHDSDGGYGIRLHMLQMVCALLANKPIVCLGQSLGPFQNQRLLGWTGRLLRRTAAVVLREGESVPTAQRMGIAPEKLHVATDMAFALAHSVDPGKATRPYQGIRRIGVTARNWWYHGDPSPKQAQARYEQALLGALDELVERYDAEIVFLPQVIGPYEDDDRLVEKRLASQLRRPERAVVLEQDMSPEALVRTISELDLVIATRFHSAIFTMLAQVPVVAIAYEHKTTGIMGRMGLQHLVLSIRTVTSAQIIACVTTIDQQYEATCSQIRVAIDVVCEQALESIALCVQAIQARRPEPLAPLTVLSTLFDDKGTR